MIAPITEDIYKAVISIAEKNNLQEIISITDEMDRSGSPEIAAQTYVAYLKMFNLDFPPVEKTRYGRILIDTSPYFAFYKVAACHGITIAEIKELYDNAVLPDIVITQIESNDAEKETAKEAVTANQARQSDVPDGIQLLASKMKNLQYFKVKGHSVNMVSPEARKLKKAGGTVEIYKVIYNGKPSFINVITTDKGISYDLNSFYCKDKDALLNEFTVRNKK